MVRIQTQPIRSTTDAGDGRNVPSEAITCPFTVVRDTQENRAGWDFSGMVERIKKRDYQVIVPMKTQRLETGDYTIRGLEDVVTCERKSISDLFGSCVNSKSDPTRRDRFKAEHIRMQKMIDAGGFACVIIEAALNEVWESPPLESGVSPNAILGTWAAWSSRYRVPWIFAGGRRSAEIAAYWQLKTWWDMLKDRNQRMLFE